MSLNPRAIAVLGVGFGALSVAYLGLWPVGVTPPPDDVIGYGGARPGIIPSRLGVRDDRDLLELMPAIVEVLNGQR